MMITLDEIISYQPPLPPKPSISPKTILPALKLPPLIHPLPQKPHSPNQLHQYGCDPISSPINQELKAGAPSYKNVFDSELAAWSDMAVETTAIVSTATEDVDQQQQHRSGSKGFGNNFHKQPPGQLRQIQEFYLPNEYQ